MVDWNLFNSWRLNTNWSWLEETIKERSSSQLEQLVKFRAAAINHLKRHIVLLLKKKPEHIILHIGTNDAVLKMARSILDALIQPKHYITNILSTYKIVSWPTIRTDNGKEALTLSNLIKTLGQLQLVFIANANITEIHVSKKGLYLKQKR